MLAISLMRIGAKKHPFYRVVVKEKRSKRDGKYLENLGTYDPMQDPADVKLNHERIQYWIGVGAQPTDTVKSLIKHNPVMTEEERAAADAARVAKRAAAEKAKADARAEADRLAAEKAEAERAAAEAEKAAAEKAAADEAAADEAAAAEAPAETEAPSEEAAPAEAAAEEAPAAEAAPAAEDEAKAAE